MGMYIFVSEQDRIEKRKIVFDKQLNDEFQEALKYDASLMIEERSRFIKKGWFKKTEVIPIYNLYHETPAYDGSAYQARFQFSGSGTREIVIAYLHGLINGCVHKIDKIYHEGSNWQAKKEDKGEPLYVNLVENALKAEIKSSKEYERYCQELEKFLTKEQIEKAYENSKK